jgi:hypothetical protein
METIENAAAAQSYSVVASVPLAAYSQQHLVLLEGWDDASKAISWPLAVFSEETGEFEFSVLGGYHYEELNNALTSFIVQANLKVQIGPRIEKES